MDPLIENLKSTTFFDKRLTQRRQAHRPQQLPNRRQAQRDPELTVNQDPDHCPFLSRFT